MTMSAFEIGMRADALVQIMRSDAPLESARGLMDGVSSQDRESVTKAFVARGWEDDNLPVPDRGTHLHDWLVGLRDAL